MSNTVETVVFSNILRANSPQTLVVCCFHVSLLEDYFVCHPIVYFALILCGGIWVRGCITNKHLHLLVSMTVCNNPALAIYLRVPARQSFLVFARDIVISNFSPTQTAISNQTRPCWLASWLLLDARCSSCVLLSSIISSRSVSSYRTPSSPNTFLSRYTVSSSDGSMLLCDFVGAVVSGSISLFP